MFHRYIYFLQSLDTQFCLAFPPTPSHSKDLDDGDEPGYHETEMVSAVLTDTVPQDTCLSSRVLSEIVDPVSQHISIRPAVNSIQ